MSTMPKEQWEQWIAAGEGSKEARAALERMDAGEQQRLAKDSGSVSALAPEEETGDAEHVAAAPADPETIGERDPGATGSGAAALPAAADRADGPLDRADDAVTAAASSRPPRTSHTRESIIEAVRAHIAEHGKAPSSGDPEWKSRATTARARFSLRWPEICREATNGLAPEDPPDPAWPSVTPGGASRSPRTALLTILTGLRELVDHYYPEEPPAT